MEEQTRQATEDKMAKLKEMALKKDMRNALSQEEAKELERK